MSSNLKLTRRILTSCDAERNVGWKPFRHSASPAWGFASIDGQLSSVGVEEVSAAAKTKHNSSVSDNLSAYKVRCGMT